MAYKSLSADLRTIRDQIQDNTSNPYASSTNSKFSGSNTKYVHALHAKPAASTPTDQELWEKEHRDSKPVLVTIHQILNPPGRVMDGGMDEWGVIVRCFVAAGTLLTFEGNRMEAEELAMEKLNEIVFEFRTNSTIIAAFKTAGFWLEDDGYGGIRPIEDPKRQDFGYAMELTFRRENQA